MSPPLVTYVRDPALVPPLTPVTFTGSFSVNVGDVTIGAVEIKDEADNRAEVPTAGGAKSTSNHVLLVQPVDTAGDVPLQSTQEDIDFNTAATNILLSTVDDHLAAIEQTGTRQLAELVVIQNTGTQSKQALDQVNAGLTNIAALISAIRPSIILIAAENIAVGLPITSSGSIASSSDLSTLGRVLGISSTAASTGQPVEVVVSGEVVDSLWSWVSGPIYVAVKDVSDVAPTVGYVQRIATVKNATTVVVSVQQPVLL